MHLKRVLHADCIGSNALQKHLWSLCLSGFTLDSTSPAPFKSLHSAAGSNAPWYAAIALPDSDTDVPDTMIGSQAIPSVSQIMSPNTTAAVTNVNDMQFVGQLGGPVPPNDLVQSAPVQFGPGQSSSSQSLPTQSLIAQSQTSGLAASSSLTSNDAADPLHRVSGGFSASNDAADPLHRVSGGSYVQQISSTAATQRGTPVSPARPRESETVQDIALPDDVSTPRRKRDQDSLTIALPTPAAARRATSYPPPLPIVQGQMVVADSQLARTRRPVFAQPHKTPDELHQEQLRKVVRTATIEARMAIRYNEHEMAAWYAERQDGWVRASEEFQRVARDVRDVELAQETCELQRQMLRKLTSEENEARRVARITLHDQEESMARTAQAAAIHSQCVAEEVIQRDRMHAEEAMQRHEPYVQQQLLDETSSPKTRNSIEEKPADAELNAAHGGSIEAAGGASCGSFIFARTS